MHSSRMRTSCYSGHLSYIHAPLPCNRFLWNCASNIVFYDNASKLLDILNLFLELIQELHNILTSWSIQIYQSELLIFTRYHFTDSHPGDKLITSKLNYYQIKWCRVTNDILECMSVILGLKVHFYRPQRSCGQVIFSQACVRNSVHRAGGVCLSVCWDTHLPGRCPPGWHPPGQTPSCPVHAGIHPLPSECWDTPPTCPVLARIDRGTAADGTHPTGMHSCY